MRGYFEIGALHTKREVNLGTLWRSAYLYGAAGIFVIGRRFQRMGSDTTATYRHVPLREHPTFEDFAQQVPFDCQVVAVETGGTDLRHFRHPERAIYLLGAEDHGLSKAALAFARHRVTVPTARAISMNVAVAGSLVMFHRWAQMNEAVS